MAKPRARTDLQALRNLIGEAQTILATTTLPEGRAERAKELLDAAVALADQLLSVRPAAILGKKGGTKTAKRGSDYFRRIAAMRKTCRGGRPRKKTPIVPLSAAGKRLLSEKQVLASDVCLGHGLQRTVQHQSQLLSYPLLSYPFL